jgi:thiol:disulfide interchange protein
MLALRAALAIAALALVGAAVPTAAAVPAPRVAVGMSGLRQPLPLPYDETADADRQVAQARARARAEGKKLLIDLGGNWCADCRVLAGVMALPEVGAFLRRHYVVVYVDVGRLDRNAQAARAYGVPKVTGVPALLVVDPRTGRLLNPGRIFALTDARHMTPQALANWLAQWL